MIHNLQQDTKYILKTVNLMERGIRDHAENRLHT